MVLSVTLHAYLIYGLALQQARSPAVQSGIINARLLSEPAEMKQTALADHSTQRIPPARPQVPWLPETVETPIPAAHTAPAGDLGPEPELAAASLPDPVHYAAKELDIYPQALHRIEPVYPQTALAAEIVGSVTLLILIDEFGRVTGVSVMDASPQDVFEESARLALAASTYAPAQKDGRAVRSRIVVKIEYDPAAMAVEE